MTYKEIAQKLVELFSSREGLEFEWMIGLPKGFKSYPSGWVSFVRKEGGGEASTSGYLYELVYEVGVADRSVDEGEAEESVYEKVELIEEAVDSNPSLDGLVEELPTPKKVYIEPYKEGRDYAVTVGRVVFTFKKWMK